MKICEIESEAYVTYEDGGMAAIAEISSPGTFDDGNGVFVRIQQYHECGIYEEPTHSIVPGLTNKRVKVTVETIEDEIVFKINNLGTNEPHDWNKFQPGEAVRKISGYEFDSVVVSVFLNTAGATRLVCESTVIPGMLHIFNPQQMEHRNG